MGIITYYRAEEWIGGNWQAISLTQSDFNHCIDLSKSVQKVSKNPVRVIDARTSQTHWYSPGTETSG